MAQDSRMITAPTHETILAIVVRARNALKRCQMCALSEELREEVDQSIEALRDAEGLMVYILSSRMPASHHDTIRLHPLNKG